ncbi:hypothetical protein [Neobacillus soli]|uniref:hypothetical protein n=1 Tax=Neobacillus soli TaxID=220688 RepID=UPI0012EE0704|nr:hypothetical protein [Neobacillus soli]
MNWFNTGEAGFEMKPVFFLPTHLKYRKERVLVEQINSFISEVGVPIVVPGFRFISGKKLVDNLIWTILKYAVHPL